jgi:phospholipase C
MNKEDTLILKRSIPILAIPRFTDNQSLKSNISDLSDYFDDILSNKLANVSFLYFTGSNDSPTTNVIPSQELVANLVYALMRSQYWNSSAILITHNEAGGWYDHVKPPINNNTAELSGFRVPAIIISPYVKSAHFDSNTYDIKAFLDIIQSSFGINNTINSINNTNRMYSVFDFAQKPRQPPLLQEIPSERVTINPEQIKGINIIYIMSLLAPIIATFCWYYVIRKSKRVKNVK